MLPRGRSRAAGLTQRMASTLGCSRMALCLLLRLSSVSPCSASPLRRLQTLESPWEVIEGSGCEVTVDGCIQTVGYPANYSGSQCMIQAHLNAYVLEPITFDVGTPCETC
eukprot:2247249-Amphidinium_carterae.1